MIRFFFPFEKAEICSFCWLLLSFFKSIEFLSARVCDVFVDSWVFVVEMISCFFDLRGERWIGTRGWRSPRRKRRLMRTRSGLLPRGGWGIISLMLLIFFRWILALSSSWACLFVCIKYMGGIEYIGIHGVRWRYMEDIQNDNQITSSSFVGIKLREDV